MVGRIVVVDENDNVVGSESRAVVDEKKLRYRVTSLWVKNSKGENLLARRAYTKSHYPGRWGPAVNGTVEEGESYEVNMKKEVEEELGLKNVEFEKGPNIEVSGDYNHFTQWFTLTVDKAVDEFEIREEEVAEIRWFSDEELEEQVKSNPEGFVKNMGKYAELFC